MVYVIFRLRTSKITCNSESGIPAMCGLEHQKHFHEALLAFHQIDQFCWQPCSSSFRVKGSLASRMFYFRDPDGHLLELATTGTWSIY